jgi:ribose/xylose/arabinose/galactoside ABC-type transport system permease subunit
MYKAVTAPVPAADATVHPDISKTPLDAVTLTPTTADGSDEWEWKFSDGTIVKSSPSANNKWDVPTLDHDGEVTYIYTEYNPLPTLPTNLMAFGKMPGNLILAVVAFIIAYLILNYTKIGTYTYAIGSNEFVAKNMGINVNKYKVLAFVISGAFLGIMAVLTISYGSSMVAVTGMASMSRNFVPTMGCFFGMAFKKYGIPLQAIIIGEFMINIIFYGFIALGAPTAIQDVITGLALLIIITLTTRVAKGEIVK